MLRYNLSQLLCFFLIISTQHLVLSLSQNSQKRVLYVELSPVTVHVDYRIFFGISVRNGLSSINGDEMMFGSKMFLPNLFVEVEKMKN